LSAGAAGLSTIVTPSLNTRHETVDGAAKVPPHLSDFDLAASGFASEAGPASAAAELRKASSAALAPLQS
jgi:hypothetical protein